MARLLVATVPLTGHVRPMLLLVRALIARGHHVQWHAAQRFARAIQATFATFAPMRAAHDWDDADVKAALPALRGKLPPELLACFEGDIALEVQIGATELPYPVRELAVAIATPDRVLQPGELREEATG